MALNAKAIQRSMRVSLNGLATNGGSRFPHIVCCRKDQDGMFCHYIGSFGQWTKAS
jgi:hypothetical protein